MCLRWRIARKGAGAIVAPCRGPGLPYHRAPGGYTFSLLVAPRSTGVVSTRLDRITEPAIDAARAGCHLVCDKPLA